MGEARAKAKKKAGARTGRKLPANLISLHSGEEFIWQKSIEEIERRADFMDHAEMVEAVMDHIDFFVHRESVDLDQETIQLLGIRLFNSLATALRQLMSGYYQVAGMIERDLLETIFLMGMFSRDRSKIAEWRDADEKTRNTKFGAFQVRTFLDEWDGFTEQKRKADYKMFCELAAHASWPGFAMLRPKGMGAHMGPFFDATALEALLSELAKLAAQAGNYFSEFFEATDAAALSTKLNRYEVTSAWAETYFGRPADKAAIAKLRKMLREIQASETTG